MSSQIRLRLLPRVRCLFDEPVQMKVAGLRSRQVVTTRARSTDEKGVVFSSSATYEADGRGEIDLERDPSLGASYIGVEPMGLLWSMSADTLHKKFKKVNSLKPHVVKFSVHEEEEEGEGRMLAEVTNERFLVGSKGVGVISLSKSGDLALSIASYLPDVEATVCINSCSANTLEPLYYKKSQVLPALLFDINNMVPTESGVFIIKNVMHNPLAEENKATLVPIEQAKGCFLFVASEDDLNWDTKAYMDIMVERLKRHGKDNFESMRYPGAGHYLEPPYGPYCPSSFHVVVSETVLWGGEPKSHAAAEVLLWKKIQEFFRTHLSCDAT
ncbi:acyl-coenzyme A thioesterase 6-like [Sebastes fasciatus]|uniref:acyl-coenzyme A thioesterase 6-like n=1 Tax=Sebastes fasciatus TaxID=394691 RepID=UPI003D9E82A0